MEPRHNISWIDHLKKLSSIYGFQHAGVTSTDLSSVTASLQKWIESEYHGEMNYMHHHGKKRWIPEQLVEGTQSIITLCFDYLHHEATEAQSVLDKHELAYISRYALGRDYHKLLRQRAGQLLQTLQQEIGPFAARIFVDSAPVLEKPLAARSGLGWQGKHTNLIRRDGGSWFFLAEIYTDLPLPTAHQIEPIKDHCGNCRRCIDICPTDAIVAPYQLDARLCISYLTIELKGSIPTEHRSLIGNRIYGCDDCQLVCPWNRFARKIDEPDFAPRHTLDQSQLSDLFLWSETDFLKRTEGMPLRRIGYARWLRNITVAIGNGPATAQVIRLLESHLNRHGEMVAEHIEWAIAQLKRRATSK